MALCRQEAEREWEIRELMRHLMEVTLVVEGEEGWAKRLAEERRKRNRPLPSVDFGADYRRSKRRRLAATTTITTTGGTTTTIPFVSADVLVKKVVGVLNTKLGSLVVEYI